MTLALVGLPKLPRSRQKHTWADYLELLCLTDPDGITSKADLVDRIRERVDLGESEDSDEVDEDDRDSVNFKGLGTRQRNDQQRELVDNLFRHAQFRAGSFQEGYPFELTPSGTKLTRRPVMTRRRRFYIYMLLASSLRYVSQDSRHLLTSSFERVSRRALARYLPPSARVYNFGTAHTSSRYRGRLWEKIGRLADDLTEKVIADEDEFDPTDTGDNGLDVVAWIPAGDRLGRRLVVFGQCACTEQWRAKQATATQDHWASVMSIRSPLAPVIFVPFCFRSPAGDWYRQRWISRGNIMIDRLRFFHLMKDDAQALRKDVPNDLIDAVVSHREPLV